VDCAGECRRVAISKVSIFFLVFGQRRVKDPQKHSSILLINKLFDGEVWLHSNISSMISSLYLILIIMLWQIAPSLSFKSIPMVRRATSARGALTTLKYKTFEEFLNSIEVPVLVDFYAQWCGPCRMMQPVLEDVANRLETVAKIAKVDTDKSPRLGSKYQVEALPTLILFNKGEVVERFIGYRNADVLEEEVKKVSSYYSCVCRRCN
jgi:thioredoxin